MKRKKYVTRKCPKTKPFKAVTTFRKGYLANVNEVGHFQIHVQLDKNSENFVTKLLVLHEGHADLQTVG